MNLKNDKQRFFGTGKKIGLGKEKNLKNQILSA